jgi:ribonuclease HII
MVDYPTCEEEQALIRAGYRLIAGLDEVGRGAWAGPVVAAAVILPVEALAAETVGQPLLGGVRDSKTLTPQQREQLWPLIYEAAIAIGVGIVPASVIDAIGIAPASFMAMRRALSAMPVKPDYLLVDAFHIPGVDIPQTGIVDGDSRCISIAASSVVAKVARDRLMTELHGDFPCYGFAHNKGYGTQEHTQGIFENGLCTLHRRSYAPIWKVLTEMFGEETPPEESEPQEAATEDSE